MGKPLRNTGQWTCHCERDRMLLLGIVTASLLFCYGNCQRAEEGLPSPSGCCDWPSCYDERVQLCLDTCLNTWSQCPPKLFLMSCYSEYMSPFGQLPLQCFPDTAAHVEEAEELGLSGTTKQIREKLHTMFNLKDCHARTGICRPTEN